MAVIYVLDLEVVALRVHTPMDLFSAAEAMS